MKIAMITETFLPNTDGIVTRLCASVKWLIDQGHEVIIIAPDLGVSEFYGAKVIGLPAHHFFLYRDKKLAYPTRKVGKVLRKFEPDLVHVVNPALLGIAGIYYAWLQKRRLVASYHTHIPKYADYYHLPIFKPFLWWFFRLLHNRAYVNLCTSEATRHDLAAHRFRNVHVWKRGVDLQQFQPNQRSSDMRDRLTGGQPSKILLLYVGRLAAEKQIEKIREVLDHSSDFCLALVGDGPQRSHLQDYFQGTNTVFMGDMHGEALAQAYASSDIFVFPSTSETLGLVILEAMASGLPVVAVASGPTSEQIEDGVSGMLYDPSRSGDFVENVVALKDPEVRSSISKKAIEISRTKGWEEPSRQLSGFYHQVLEMPKK